MKEKRINGSGVLICMLKKPFRLLKLAFLFIVLSQANICEAAVNHEHKVSLQMSDVSLEKVILELRKQTGVRFFYSIDKIKAIERVSIDARNETLKNVLNRLLSGTGLTYTLLDEVVVIKDEGERIVKDSVQKVLIQGIVKDQRGGTLPGVSVIVKGTSVGVATDVSGTFTLQVPAQERIALVFSFVGMKTKEVPYKGAKLVVVMEEESQSIDEVVVTGYQVIDKRSLTSAISTVKAEDLDRVGALTIDQMLEGKAPGLMIMNMSAQPGAATKMRVRAGATFTGTREPLWVIDGVIYEDPVPLTPAEINSLDNVNLIGNAITGLNPQDIAQIDILKDASATAIYGTRAANGVIVVTTKRGKSGSLALNYSGSVSVVNRPRYSDLNLMNSKERIDVSREIAKRNLFYPSEIHQFVGYEGALKKYYFREIDYAQFQREVARLEALNEDWFGELYRVAVTHGHSVNLSGGTDKMRIYAGLSYDNQIGTEINVGLYRISGRINGDFNLRKNVLISIGLSGSSQKAKYNYGSYSVFDEAYNMSRAVPAREENGELCFIDRISVQNTTGDYRYVKYNILNELDHSGRTVYNRDFNVRASVDWEIIKGLKIRSQFSFRNTANSSENWIGAETYYMSMWRSEGEDADEDSKKGAMVPFGGLYSSGSVLSQATSISTQINYNKSVGEQHYFNLNIGQEASSTIYKGTEGWTAPGYNHEQGRSFIKIPSFLMTEVDKLKYPFMLHWLSVGGVSSIYPTITDRVTNVMSVFAIFNYSFLNKYIFNFNIRSDGSNQFGQYQRYKFRPAWSTSVRWNLHDESFAENWEFVDELALRLSYGFRGNPPSASPYLTIRNYGQSNTDVSPEYVSELASFPNANLKWERTKTFNVGLNHAWLGGRISGALDYGYSRSVDLLLSRPTSLVNGAAYQLYNGGSKEDHTFEFNIMTQNIKTKNFQWNMNFNITHVKEKILNGINEDVDFSTVESFLNGSIYMKGFPIDGFYSYRFGGLDSNGLPTFEGLVADANLTNRDNYWDTRTIYAQLQKALVYEGSRLPLFYGGFGTEFKYKNLRLSASFTYKIGQKVRLLEMYGENQTMPLPQQNMSGEFNNRWRKPGDEAHTNVPALSNEELVPAYTLEEAVSPYVLPWQKSYWWAYDRSNVRTAKGDYIRWQLLTLNYDLPDRYLKRTGISNMRFGLQVQNIGCLTFDKKLKGKDPEQVRSVGMPVLPSYNFSCSFSF